MDAARRSGGAALIYFCALFTALGLSQLVRELMVLSGLDSILGQVAGSLLVAMILLPAAEFAVKTFDVPPSVLARLAVGLAAVAMMFAVGLIEVVFFRRFFEEHLHAGRDPILLPLALGLLAFALVVPLFVARHRQD